MLLSLAFALGRIQLLCSADTRLIIKAYSFLRLSRHTDTAAVIIRVIVHDVVWRLFIAYSPLSELLEQAMQWATSCKSSRLALCFTVIGFFFPYNHPKNPEFLELKFFCKPPTSQDHSLSDRKKKTNNKIEQKSRRLPRTQGRSSGFESDWDFSQSPLRPRLTFWLVQLRFLFFTLETPTNEAASKVTFSEQRQTIKLWDEKPWKPSTHYVTLGLICIGQCGWLLVSCFSLHP